MKILLAEDERSLARALAAILEHNGYFVDIVHNGAEVLEYLESERYDGVILDLMMPVMDGMTALIKIREQGNMVPVLILTARSDVDDKVKGLDQGANDYLTKPFETRELLARIRAMTRNRLQAGDSVLTYGNISLNRATKEVSSPSGCFTLTNKEFQVLELLMTDPHCLIPTERIMEKVWGYESDAEINVVWAYISYVRKKLAALKANVQIKAARNSGYSLEVI